MLVSAVAAFAGAILGSIVSGYYLILKVREEKRLELFSDVLDNFYAPFQEITKAVIDKNEISAETRRKLQELIYKNRKWIILCPDSIKKSTNDLFKNLRDENYEGALKKINIIKKEIDKITDKISFKG
jgi:flagellar biosynthesis regulator FlaF